MKKFRLTNVVLYAKGWYERTDDMYADLKKILELDNYTPFTNGDVYAIILYAYQDYVMQNPNFRFAEFLNDISQESCWKYGYFTEGCTWGKKGEALLKYNLQTAIIKKILSDCNLMDRECWEIKCPKYSKENPRPKRIELKHVIDVFNRKQTN